VLADVGAVYDLNRNISASITGGAATAQLGVVSMEGESNITLSDVNASAGIGSFGIEVDDTNTLTGVTGTVPLGTITCSSSIPAALDSSGRFPDPASAPYSLCCKVGENPVTQLERLQERTIFRPEGHRGRCASERWLHRAGCLQPEGV
jgi:hypothetical protein